MDFSIRLENLLEEKNLKQKQLALDLHIANSTINGYITGYRKPDFDMLVRLAHYFDVSTDYLLGLSSERHSDPPMLTPEERSLIEIYRSLSPKQQKLFRLQAELHCSPSE